MLKLIKSYFRNNNVYNKLNGFIISVFSAVDFVQKKIVDFLLFEKMCIFVIFITLLSSISIRNNI